MLRKAIAECLALEAASVHAHSRLINDLGADSLDFIDLIFTLEKQFGVRIREEELNAFSRPATVGGGDPSGAEFLPSAAVGGLLPWLPELAKAGDLSRIRPAQILPMITVEALWQLVELKAKSRSR